MKKKKKKFGSRYTEQSKMLRTYSILYSYKHAVQTPECLKIINFQNPY